MKALYFDTETTGLRSDGFILGGNVYPGKICQLAYIMDEDGVLTPKNFYFAVEASAFFRRNLQRIDLVAWDLK